MTKAKKPEPYERMQFSLPKLLAAQLKELTRDLRTEAQREGVRALNMTEIVSNGLRREIRRQRKAFEKRQERAEAE